MRYAMVINLDKCVGCQTCAVVCKMHNSQPPGTWWNRAFTQGAAYHQTAIGKDGEYKYLIASKSIDLKSEVKNMNAALCGKGGGSAVMVQGTFLSSITDIEKYFT